MNLIRIITTAAVVALSFITGVSFVASASVINIADEGDCSEQHWAVPACDGYFCDKTLSTMFLFMTHNSYATPDRVWAKNQNSAEGDQFEAGIRGFNFDIYDIDGELSVDHTPNDEVWTPAPYVDSVNQILEKMDRCEHKDEIVVVEFEIKKGGEGTHKLAAEPWGDKVITDFNSSTPFSHYIAKGQRVLLLTNKNISSPSMGMYRRSDHISQNGYEWSCEMNTPDFAYREGPKNDANSAKMMNHFCYTFKLPDESESEKMNDKYVILHNSRIFAKQREFGTFPNIVAVDFYDKGNIWPAQDLIRMGKQYVGDELVDGTVCAAGTSCWKCRGEYSFWTSKTTTACGDESAESCLPEGTACAKGATCNNCCGKTHEYWYSRSANACGSEPCWDDSRVCGRWTSCNACCNSDGILCPWWGFGFACECGE